MIFALIVTMIIIATAVYIPFMKKKEKEPCECAGKKKKVI